MPSSSAVLLALVASGADAVCDVPPGTEGADDGNPHCWDRLRRCDGPEAHPDDGPGYTPACGLCEGIGGNVWGDDNDKIEIAKCTPIASADEVEPRPAVPEWAWGNGGKFTVENDRFLMIGKKEDPFCFNFVPSNNSTGAQCYRRQTGKLYVDATPGMQALRYDLNVHIPWPSDKVSLFGNITATILHRNESFWVQMNLYGLMDMCVCTKVCSTNPCPPSPFPAFHPVTYNWTKHMSYLGREQLEVEYGIGELEVEHWIYAAHHAWTEVGSNKIVRMWHPYAGFEVFAPGSWRDGVADPAVFEQPPALCKKGGALARITCTDEGWPDENAGPHVAGIEAATHPSTVADLRRARTKVPRDSHKASGFSEMASKLNGLIRGYAGAKECAEWSVHELQRFQGLVLLLRDHQLQESYLETGDRRVLQGDMTQHASRWARLRELAEEFGGASAEMHRDGHCHEAVMWFTHHLSESARQLIVAKTEVPLLPYSRHSCNPDEELCKQYVDQVTCLDCHGDISYEPEISV